ncbi:hypothetical protein K438DRAFT_1763219 [Mycena galopus ATCC 62051]|nr:hypothetical protein K438DRAFT_1763219 [Mycena galopus ATCC 62051]
MTSPPALWTPAQDKALKTEALRCINQQSGALPIQLTMWLDFYGAPKTAFTHESTAQPSQQDVLYTRLAANQANAAVKKARVANLLTLRTEAIKASARRWPRPRCHPHHDDNVAVVKKRLQEEEARRAEEHAKECAEAEARVAFLMKMRQAGGKGRLRIARTERLSILLLTKSLNAFLRFLLYRYILVGASAPKLVRSLQFVDGSLSASINPRLWALILPQMERLQFLGIASDIPLSQATISSLTCRLTGFEAIFPVRITWGELIASQAGLDELIFHGEFHGEVPGPDLLPRLRSIRALPADVTRFARAHRLTDAWFLTLGALGTATLSPRALNRLAASPSRLLTLRISAPNVLLSLAAAPAVFSTLEHLVLDEDLTWSDFTLFSDTGGLARSTWGEVACALNRTLSHLHIVLLICSHSMQDRAYRRRLTCDDAPCFARIFAANSTAPGLRSFRFYAMDGYAVWTGWGQEDEELFANIVVVIPPIESQHRVRPAPQPFQIPVRDPEVEATLTEFANNIVHACESVKNATDGADAVDLDLASEEGRVEEESERARVWGVVVELAVELMREPERRQWLRDQRMEEDLQQMGMWAAADWTGAAEHRILPSTTVSMDSPSTDLHRGEHYMPSFHITLDSAYKQLCFSMPSFHVGVGAVDGEGSEHWWTERNQLVESRRKLHRLLAVWKHLHKHKYGRGMREHERFWARMLSLNEQIERVARGFYVDDEGDIIPLLENEYSSSLRAKL